MHRIHGGLSHRDSLRCVAASQCEYCSGGDGGYGYTHFAGPGRCGWYVQGGVGRLLLGMACHKGIFLGILIVYLFPRIGRWFFRRYDDNVMQFIFVLAMVFLGAGLMEFVGMEGILGAFLAGLVLNRLIPHVSPLITIWSLWATPCLFPIS